MPVRRVSACPDLSARRNLLHTIPSRSASGSSEATGLDRRDGLSLIHVFRISAHVETTGELVYKRVGNGDAAVERLPGPGGRRMGIQAHRQARDRFDRTSF